MYTAITILIHIYTIAGKEIMFQMKFCEPIQVQGLCEPGENAMVLRGEAVMPLEVVDVACRCPRDTPLFLKESRSQGWRSYQKFQCQQV